MDGGPVISGSFETGCEGPLESIIGYSEEIIGYGNQGKDVGKRWISPV